MTRGKCVLRPPTPPTNNPEERMEFSLEPRHPSGASPAEERAPCMRVTCIFHHPPTPPKRLHSGNAITNLESLLVNYLSDPPARASSAQGTQLSDRGCNFLRPTLRDTRAATGNRGSLKILPSLADVGWGMVINLGEGG